MGVRLVQFLDYQISVPLIGFDFPSRRSAAEDAIEKSSLRTFFHDFTVGGRRGGSGSGALHLLPPTSDGPRTHTLGIDLESLLESRFEPLNSVSGSNCSEVIAMQEGSKVTLPVIL